MFYGRFVYDVEKERLIVLACYQSNCSVKIVWNIKCMSEFWGILEYFKSIREREVYYIVDIEENNGGDVTCCAINVGLE